MSASLQPGSGKRYRKAPRLAGSGALFAPELPAPIELSQLAAEHVGDDLLLSGYVHEP